MSDIVFEASDVRTAGLRKLGEGRAAEVFEWGHGVALKLMRRPEWRQVVEAEAAAMHAAEESGVPAPRFLGVVEVEGRPGILMERLDGPDQLTLLGKKPWKVWSVGTTLGRLHAQLHSVPVGAGLPSLKDAVRRDIESSSLVPDDVRRLALDALEQRPDGNYVCHGDFHPANIIETPDGPRVIDWSNAVRGDRLADLARTMVLFSGEDLGVSPPLLVRLLDRVGRRLVWFGYERAYRRLRPYDRADLEAWIPVAAAQRIADNIPGEAERLVRIVRERLGGAE